MDKRTLTNIEWLNYNITEYINRVKMCFYHVIKKVKKRMPKFVDLNIEMLFSKVEKGTKWDIKQMFSDHKKAKKGRKIFHKKSWNLYDLL